MIMARREREREFTFVFYDDGKVADKNERYGV
jgi:hypothetical protein